MNAAKPIDGDTRLHKALSHPLRREILIALEGERVASPTELATELGASLGTVSYHVKTLLDLDALELVRTQPVRGALEHFYKAKIRPTITPEDRRKLPASVRRSLAGQDVEQIWSRVAAAGDDGGLEDPRTQMSWSSLELDEQGYEAVTKLLADAMARVAALQDEAAKRLQKLDEAERTSQRTELAVMHLIRGATPEEGET